MPLKYLIVDHISGIIISYSAFSETHHVLFLFAKITKNLKVLNVDFKYKK
jgi:hypothetical protein